MTSLKPRVKAGIITVFLTIFAGLVNADLTVIPTDTEVQVGKPVRFLCSTSIQTREIHWFYTPVGVKDNEKDLVYGFGQINKNNPKYGSRFQLEKNFDTGAMNLLITNVEIGDSGRYICEDDAGFGNRSSAQLIVLENTPVCQSNMRTDEVIGPNSCGIDADKLVLSCSVSHHGNVPPLLEWSRVGEDKPIIEGVTSTTIENTTTCNLPMRGDLAMNHASYKCQASRATPGTTDMSCTSDTVKILYAFNSFSIIKKQRDDFVHCTANSSLSCSYEWKYYGEGIEQTLEPGRNRTLKDVGLYRCEANCKIKQKPCIVSVSLVHVTSYSDGPFKAAFIVVLILLVIFIVLFFVFLLRWRKDRSPASPEEPGREYAELNFHQATHKDRIPASPEELEREYAKLKFHQETHSM